MHTTTAWDVKSEDTTVPSNAAEVEAAFSEIMTPVALSSGWVCTLTIECGTFVCACR